MSTYPHCHGEPAILSRAVFWQPTSAVFFPLLSEDTALSTDARDDFWVVRDVRREWNTVRFANCVVHSPNNEMIVSGREDGTVRVWDGQTGIPIGSTQKDRKTHV